MSANPICYEPDEQRWLSSDAIPLQSPKSSCSVFLEGGIEKHVNVGELDSLNFYGDNADMLGMLCIPKTISDYLKERFCAIKNVRALLIGESHDVQHVWVLLDEWTVDHRKAIYAIQRDILQKVTGFNFDFYVVDIPPGTSPSEMVSGIPVIYQRD
jgi:hypothetical protein